MSLSIGGITVDALIMPPNISNKWRARSVRYSLDGTALEDRLGSAKKTLTLPFGVIPQSKWESLKNVLSQKTVTVSGYIGSLYINSKFRVSDDEIPTPILYVDENSQYVCRPFTINMEEI